MKLQYKPYSISLLSVCVCLGASQANAGFLDDIKSAAKSASERVVNDIVEDAVGNKPSAPPEEPSAPVFVPAESAKPPKNTFKQKKLTYDRRLVSDTQRQLNRLGYDVGAVDGLYGKGTRKGVRDFQRDQNLSVNGTPSASLLSHMEKISIPVTTQLASNKPEKNDQVLSVEELSAAQRTAGSESKAPINKNTVPEAPAGAEEKTTDLYLAIVRMRPDLLVKRFGSHSQASLLDVMLKENPQRYGLNPKEVNEFISNEFVHHERLQEYKKLVVQESLNVPLVFRRKVQLLFSKYDFTSNVYMLPKLEVSTIYDPPFIRLFEGFKAVEGLGMSPHEAERLTNWYLEDGRGFGGKKPVAAYWNYEIKSIKHASELSSSPHKYGFVATVEPSELMYYAARSINDSSAKQQKSSSVVDPLEQWRKSAAMRAEMAAGFPHNPEFVHLETFSLKNLSDENSVDTRQIPSFDVVGVKLGVSPESVASSLKEHNANLVMNREMRTLKIPESKPYLYRMASRGVRQEQFTVWFAAPPLKNSVIRITRDLRLRDKPAPLDGVIASLEKKYGKPVKSKRLPSQNRTFYNHEYVWQDEGADGELKVTLGIRNNESVELMQFQAGLSGSTHDITTRYQRNQQLWRSYHQDTSTQKNDRNISSKDVPAF